MINYRVRRDLTKKELVELISSFQTANATVLKDDVPVTYDNQPALLADIHRTVTLEIVASSGERLVFHDFGEHVLVRQADTPLGAFINQSFIDAQDLKYSPARAVQRGRVLEALVFVLLGGEYSQCACTEHDSLEAYSCTDVIYGESITLKIAVSVLDAFAQHYTSEDVMILCHQIFTETNDTTDRICSGAIVSCSSVGGTPQFHVDTTATPALVGALPRERHRVNSAKPGVSLVMMMTPALSATPAFFNGNILSNEALLIPSGEATLYCVESKRTPGGATPEFWLVHRAMHPHHAEWHVCHCLFLPVETSLEAARGVMMAAAEQWIVAP
jgi:hypothetical protein